jgi:hypothetical protein
VQVWLFKRYITLNQIDSYAKFCVMLKPVGISKMSKTLSKLSGLIYCTSTARDAMVQSGLVQVPGQTLNLFWVQSGSGFFHPKPWTKPKLQITGEFECNFCNASFLPPPSHITPRAEHLSIQNHNGSLSQKDVLGIAAVTWKGLYIGKTTPCKTLLN